MNKKRLRRRCNQCGNIFSVYRRGDPRSYNDDTVYIVWRTDPFAEEINEDHTRMWLCSDCAYDLTMEI